MTEYESQVLSVIASLTAPNTRLLLRDLRPNLTGTRAMQDSALLSLERGGHLILYGNDNAAELTNRDHLAALNIAGHPRHLLRWTPQENPMAAKKKAKKTAKRKAKTPKRELRTFKELQLALALKKHGKPTVKKFALK